MYVVNYGVFQKKQPFLEFLREVMRHSPCGKYYKRDRTISRIEIDAVVNYLDRNQNAKYYDDEIEFLLKHCKRKCSNLLSIPNYFFFR